MNALRRSLVGVLFVAISYFPLWAGHEGGHDDSPDDWSFSITKSGEVRISGDVTIGRHLVKKGKYAVAHRIDGANHTFVLSSIEKKDSSQPSIVEFVSRFRPSSESVKYSKFFAKKQKDGSYEVLLIEIAGENGEHIVSK